MGSQIVGQDWEIDRQADKAHRSHLQRLSTWLRVCLSSIHTSYGARQNFHETEVFLKGCQSRMRMCKVSCVLSQVCSLNIFFWCHLWWLIDTINKPGYKSIKMLNRALHGRFAEFSFSFPPVDPQAALANLGIICLNCSTGNPKGTGVMTALATSCWNRGVDSPQGSPLESSIVV